MRNLKLFVRLGKIDEAQRIVYGTAADETLDHVKESFDYDGSKPYFKAWSDNAAKITDGKSLGNVRAMHGKVAAGKLDQLEFDDDAKKILVGAKIVDDNEWAKVLEGVYTGFSIGGRYVSQRTEKGITRYVAEPSEISLVDLPCIPTATFDVVKADGSTLQKMFKPGEDAVLVKAKELAALAKKDPEKDAAEFMDAARAELAKVVKDPASIEVDAEVAPAPAADAVEPTNEQIVAKASELAKAKGGNWMAHTDEAVALLKAAAAIEPKVEPKPAAEAAPDPRAEAAKAAGAQPGDDEGAQVWTHPELSGQTFTKKADMRTALTKARADKAAEVTAKPAADALAALETELGKKDGKAPKAKGAKDAKADADDNGTDQDKQQKKQLNNEAATGTGDADKAVLAALVKAGAALSDGTPIATAENLAAAIADLGKGVMAPTDRRRLVLKHRELKLEIPDALKIVPQTIDTPELKKAASLYLLSDMISLLASTERCEECLETPGYYDQVDVPAELKTRFGAALVEFGSIVAEVLDLILAAMQDEEAGEAMSRAAGATDLIKGLAESPVLTKLLKLAPVVVAEPGDLEKLTAERDAERAAFAKTIGEMTGTLSEVTKRITALEATPLPPGTSTVTPALKIVDKSADGAGTTLQGAEEVLTPVMLGKLADAAVRLAQQKPNTAIRNGGT